MCTPWRDSVYAATPLVMVYVVVHLVNHLKVTGSEFCLNYNQGMSLGKGMESANNDARKWPILPFDIISKEILPFDIISKEILV